MNGEPTVLVTGASGFVGRAVCAALSGAGRRFRRAVRSAQPAMEDAFVVGDVGPATDWRAALEGVDCVVHLVARTHVLRDTAGDPLGEYRRVNVDSTLRLAEQALRAGVRRLVYMSSVKVNGEATQRPYTEADAPRPEDAYGVTKREAEEGLVRLAAGTSLQTVTLRPPLVYGPGVKGNFLRLLDNVARGAPLPFASVVNRRSLVYVGNLADATVKAAVAPAAAGRTFLVSDGIDFSTPELVRSVARALGVRPRLLPCPPAALTLLATLLGRRAEIARLTGSLQVDSSAIRRDLGWRPPWEPEQGLADTARWYRARSSA